MIFAPVSRRVVVIRQPPRESLGECGIGDVVERNEHARHRRGEDRRDHPGAAQDLLERWGFGGAPASDRRCAGGGRARVLNKPSTFGGQRFAVVRSPGTYIRAVPDGERREGALGERMTPLLALPRVGALLDPDVERIISLRRIAKLTGTPVAKLQDWASLAGMLDTLSGLTIVFTLSNLPIMVWMLYTYFRDIPAEILEAARMDAAVHSDVGRGEGPLVSSGKDFEDLGDAGQFNGRRHVGAVLGAPDGDEREHASIDDVRVDQRHVIPDNALGFELA